jgi:3-oxoacyl-[acyl-carrier-protein] synthase III
MPSIVPVGIAGTGSYLPERVVPNQWFESFLDTSDEWIVQRTGISERRFAADDQATSDLATEAARRALEAANCRAEDLDLVVLGTFTGDCPVPATAAIVQSRLGATRAAAFDCSAACTGFLTALQIGSAWIASGRARRVLVIGAEVQSRFIDLTDRSSCILFGDGAGAVVLAPHAECGQGEILRDALGADGSGYDMINIPGGGSRTPSTQASLERHEQYIHLKGREVFKFAVAKMSGMIEQMLEGHDRSELGLIVPHQVNRRIIDASLNRLGMDDERVLVNIQHYGNTSAASVPIALDEGVRTGRLQKGQLCVLVAFGAGMTWGGNLLRW